jgi:hypothetical protein
MRAEKFMPRNIMPHSDGVNTRIIALAMTRLLMSGDSENPLCVMHEQVSLHDLSNEQLDALEGVDRGGRVAALGAGLVFAVQSGIAAR